MSRTLFYIPLGTLRAYYLAFTVMIAGFMAGYDSGVAGGVLTFPSFESDFGYPSHPASATKAKSKTVNSFTVGFQQLGSFVACFLIYPVTARYGRRLAIQVASCVFLVGVVCETVVSRSLA